ncbi:hypothetical protein Taro_042440 [Colocasia esculenta]|uniref:non-specific serine/threonine protein kinase n=1 Tax=Colocasia esculenta TaxID=4460 RepID=A0A843WP05_COLES|nr:hypothetical protein [Colocasia esculenta]
MAAAVLVLLCMIFFHACDRSTADTLSNIPLKSSCAGNYSTENNTFQANLNNLFSSLNARAPVSNFYNDSSGGGADRAYGLYMCEGDLSSDDCRSCVETATTGVLESCPSNRQGIIWYDYCQVRFADYDFFGVADARGGFSRTNTYSTVFNPSLPLGVLSRLVEDAPSQPLKFAANASVTAGVYAMAQCTDDLSRSDCRGCLETILQNIRDCCSTAEGYRYLSPSCWVRYEATPFLWNVNSTFTSIIVPRCTDDSFPVNSSRAWETNLGNLLSSLASNSSQRSGFSTNTVGVGSARLYGLALCRGDLANSTGDCQTCLANASSSMIQMCPQKTQGIIWYEKCEVRYSNESFFGVVDGVGRTFCGLKDTSQTIDAASLSLMSRLVEEAPDQNLLFAAGSVQNVSGVASSYGLVQCTRDLSSEDCRSCLRGGMANASSACQEKRGWRFLSGSCNLRYEDFAFFDTSVALPMPNFDGSSGKLSKTLVAVIIVAVLGAVLLGFLIFLLWQRKRRTHHVHGRTIAYLDDLETLGDTELRLVDLGTVKEATDDFADSNKIGGGGFGTVYKGVLRGGEEIAIKRLSTRSNQGPEEFKNEVILIAKLQHRNLVRILGCCLEGEEKMIIYEYMPNGSLDAFIFDERNRSCLGWKSRFSIIVGIARGLLYLHEDSQLKIIHRDLKPSNVLLDSEMNPKISDFGMAKIIRRNENEAISGRVVGTYGYLAPEYALNGKFSVKSDVFSFGVLLLEIVSGQKNGSSHFVEHGLTLLQNTWQLWAEGEGLQLVDPLIAQSCPANEALWCIRIGLLCVQESPESRPTMSSVALMLMSNHMELPEPSRPPSFAREVVDAVRSPSSNTGSVNTISITDIVPR